MKRFAERSQLKIGLVGIAIVAAVLAVTFNIGPLSRMVAGSEYSAAFTDSAGLTGGSEVRVSGMKVGSVQSVELEGAQVIVRFTAGDTRLGSLTRAAIKTRHALGGRVLELTPRGRGELDNDEMIPVERTDTPYSITDAVQDTAATAGKIDTRQLARSFDTLSETFADTPDELRGALSGLRKLSKTIASRDEALAELLSNADGVTGVLAERSTQVTKILTDGNALLGELEARRDVIDALLTNLTGVTKQISGLVKDNRSTLKPALTELNKTLAILKKNKGNLEKAIKGFGAYASSLGETVGGGPFFYALLQNLPPTNLAPVLPELLGPGGLGSEGPR